jgi:hypothetical protein
MKFHGASLEIVAVALLVVGTAKLLFSVVVGWIPAAVTASVAVDRDAERRTELGRTHGGTSMRTAVAGPFQKYHGDAG